MDWLRDNCSVEWDVVLLNFFRSLAGACVFEYVLGIGDRHSDNILVSTTGLLFHIDFALFLGNDYGPAASAPFTLTPLMQEVLGAQWARFCDTLVAAYLAVRRHHVWLTGLLLLAASCRMPHLHSIESVLFLRDVLAPHLTRDEAAAGFRRRIHEAANHKGVRINDAMHNAHQAMLAMQRDKE